MSQSAHVVDGEASESDSDIEIGTSPDVDSPSNTKGFVIAGEAPESDDESKLSPPPLQTIITPEQQVIPAPKSPQATIHNSLLHQKLYEFEDVRVCGEAYYDSRTGEANVCLRANVEGLVKHSIDISVEKLTKSDRTLLSVQESMRATNANLTLARARLKQLREQLEKANCSAALPTVKLK